ncbi:hypothetical protein AS9A_P20024 (plasmid) [Hoyosella subflava DQS3-9A1]|uniref:Uncharacterized protein n=1 Tax=Hoyosella subflava (strain DSM 45089 / JCM 17490 / NBRC 109087 / DQS3-9A1) TaxID=443218 RepID=F6ESE7_HOYSD|nr:hypothetical protein AS9A_P20024 [Hoyosella subflava DQS3-9A1]
MSAAGTASPVPAGKMAAQRRDVLPGLTCGVGTLIGRQTTDSKLGAITAAASVDSG